MEEEEEEHDRENGKMGKKRERDGDEGSEV